MTNRTLWDEQFKELNSIEMSQNQKIKLWKNITAKKHNRFEVLKNSLIFAVAAALFLVLSASFISRQIHHQTKNHSAEAPTKQTKVVEPPPVPTQQLTGADSAGWELISRARYDLGVIEAVQTKQNEISITVKREKSLGSDADPLGPVTKPDSGTRTYILKTSQPEQTLHLAANQKVLLQFGQYMKKDAADWIWAAEVVGVAQKDDKFYNPDGSPLTLNISSQVTIEEGMLNIKE